MIATITKIENKMSKYGGNFLYVFFMGSDGRSYRSCLYPKMRNYNNWVRYLHSGNVLANLHLKGEALIDADSKPVKVNNIKHEFRKEDKQLTMKLYGNKA